MGSDDDEALNAAIPRHTADAAALTAILGHQAAGNLTALLVPLHTTLDASVPYWHEPRYRGKVILSDNIAQHENVTVER